VNLPLAVRPRGEPDVRVALRRVAVRVQLGSRAGQGSPRSARACSRGGLPGASERRGGSTAGAQCRGAVDARGAQARVEPRQARAGAVVGGELEGGVQLGARRARSRSRASRAPKPGGVAERGSGFPALCAAGAGASPAGSRPARSACPLARARTHAAVFTHRLFQLVVPALLGAPAFVMLGRKLMRASRLAAVCARRAAWGYAGRLERRWWTRLTTIAPSPTAVAQRLVEPDRTSPAA
jgi:hypothetical protein